MYLMMQTPWKEMIEADAAGYVRWRDLPKVLNARPDNWRDEDVETTGLIVRLLGTMARTQANLAENNHWSYSHAKHVAVLAALKAEQAKLAHLRNVQGLAKIVRAAAE